MHPTDAEIADSEDVYCPWGVSSPVLDELESHSVHNGGFARREEHTS